MSAAQREFENLRGCDDHEKIVNRLSVLSRQITFTFTFGDGSKFVLEIAKRRSDDTVKIARRRAYPGPQKRLPSTK